MKTKKTKYVFITGGVTSSLGKGIISSSLGMLLKSIGYKVNLLKFDPYFNIDSGTLNPYEHGECFVTQDGTETDMDLGHYERFLNQNMTKNNNITSGIIYKTVIDNERKGKYLGKTVQVIPHITDEIKRRIKLIGNSCDIIITEIGGTVGDIEILPYIESLRQLKRELGDSNILVIHLTLIPFISVTGELKTKPTQHSVRNLMKNGVQVNIIVCRSKKHISEKIKKKLALFCNVEYENVIESIDTKIIYEIPYLLHYQKFDKIVLDHLNLNYCYKKNNYLSKWKIFLKKYKNPKYKIIIALVGKYVNLHDSYKSIIEALIHAGTKKEIYIEIKWIHSDIIKQKNIQYIFKNISGILIAPGFGNRGINGKILATKYARENKIPFLGICLGMQILAIEFARNVLGIKKAESHEFNPNTSYPIINLMKNQQLISNKKGGTMRLGNWKCNIKKKSKLFSIYNKEEVYERHRHRYEFNNDYIKNFSKLGMKIVGINLSTGLVEALELENHLFFIGVQFHPEYNSTLINPHPLFISFVSFSKKYKSLKI